MRDSIGRVNPLLEKPPSGQGRPNGQTKHSNPYEQATLGHFGL
jgi:hypothetical protein